MKQRLMTILVLCLISAIVSGQESDDVVQADQATSPPAADTEKKPPSLDDLLGIDEEDDEADDRAAAAARREREEELQRELDEVDLVDAFQQAIEKMTISADLLDIEFDPGLGTQRVQEDILAKLASLIDQAKKQGSSGSSSSSSSSSSSGNPNQPAPKPGSDSSGKNGQRNQTPGNAQPGDPPAMQQGDVNEVIEESKTEWGGLPQRIRDQLEQGKYEDRKSKLYEQLTDAYYERLARDATNP